jgi:hypothetical protein
MSGLVESRRMRKTLLWLGGVLCGIGATLIVVSAGLSYLGLGTSYNFGDPAKFQFVLVPFWQIGLAIAILGGACLIGWRWLEKSAP